MKKLFTILLLLLTVCAFAQPSNDNCANATALSVNGALVCGTTNNATSQTGENCAASGAGISPRTVWYSFVATQSTMVLNFIRTNAVNCVGRLSVYGPNASCLPSSTSAILNCSQLTGDPGVYQSLTGLTIGATYLIQYNGQDCGGSGSGFHNFCIGVYTVAANNTIASPSAINNCGTTFNGTTGGGYTPSGSGSTTGFANLDNNNTTTCPTCGTAGNDVPFVINNDSWFSFCAGNAGTWQISFNVGTCVLSGANSGAQMALLTGSTNSLTYVAMANNPTYAGGSWTSPTFSMAAGQCAYLVVDGFAGDACSYSYVLTNVTGGCIVLPIQLSSFTLDKTDEKVILNWSTATEKNNKSFFIERSIDGVHFIKIGEVPGAGNSQTKRYYSFQDPAPAKGTNYYRLISADTNGDEKVSAYGVINFGIVEAASKLIVTDNESFSVDFKPLLSLNEIRVYTSSGLLIRTVQKESSSSLDLRSVSPGVYFVKASDGYQTVCRKILIR